MARVLSEQEFRDCVRPLQGMKISLAWKGYGSAIFLELGQLSPPEGKHGRRERGEACLMIEWDWRVENATSVLFGSSNSGPEIEASIRGLQGSCTTNVSAVGSVPELVVLFSTGQCLRSMMMTSGNPEWGIKLPSGPWLSTRDGMLWLDAEAEGSTDAEIKELEVSESTGNRWGIPIAEPVGGKCHACHWFRGLDANFCLIEYGVCISRNSAFDGRVVHRTSGCPVFKAVDSV